MQAWATDVHMSRLPLCKSAARQRGPIWSLRHVCGAAGAGAAALQACAARLCSFSVLNCSHCLTSSRLLPILIVVVQEPYKAEGPSQEVQNVDAVALLLALLREARPPVQAWGLAALLRLLRGSTANLSACDRCADTIMLNLSTVTTNVSHQSTDAANHRLSGLVCCGPDKP